MLSNPFTGAGATRIAHPNRWRYLPPWSGYRRQTISTNLLTGLAGWWPCGDNDDSRCTESYARRDVTGGGAAQGPGKGPTMATTFSNAGGTTLRYTSNAAVQLGTGIGCTLCCWVRFASFPVAGSSGAALVTKDDVATNREFSMNYVALGGGTARMSIGNGATLAQVTSIWNPTALQWYFFLGTYNPTGPLLSISVDNVVLGTAVPAITPVGNAAPVQLGGDGRAGITFVFDGQMQRAGYWRRVLTTEEQTYLWNAGVGRDYPFISP